MKLFFEKIFFSKRLKDLFREKKSPTISKVLSNFYNDEREFTPEEKNMLDNVIGFASSRVEDCMVPRADIVSIELRANVAQILKIFSECNHSRLPIYKDTLDNPVGMIHIKDLIGVISKDTFAETKIESFLREVIFVPPSMKSRDLLLRMQSSRIHMALVIDEYGGTDGLITIEDLIEEIVGEIDDELYEEDPDRIIIAESYIDVSARTNIEEISGIIGFSLYPDDIDEEISTIGGLVFILAGRVPQRGELVIHPLGFEIEIRDADARKIKKVRLRIKAHEKPQENLNEPQI
tara:strand:+ start:105 stop:980 length:876 start_codon:yes stop_codon:yes gene_type:complete